MSAPVGGAAPAPGSAPGVPTDVAAATTPGDVTAPSLPELRVRNVGLHIGGGRNDEAEKEPFKRAIESRFEDFMRCYRLAEQPEKGGTFGVDLFIGRAGGKADVRQPRTGIKGDGFRDCMVAEFGNVQFQRPSAGPTIISYSLKFELQAQ